MTVTPKRLQSYESDHIVVTFDPNACIHSGNCVRGLPSVFGSKVTTMWSLS